MATYTAQAYEQSDTAKTPKTTVTVGAADTSLVAANPSRVCVFIQNTHATQTVDLALGATAVAANGIRLPAAMALPLQITSFTGEIRAIASGAGTTVQVAEV